MPGTLSIYVPALPQPHPSASTHASAAGDGVDGDTFLGCSDGARLDPCICGGRGEAQVSLCELRRAASPIARHRGVEEQQRDHGLTVGRADALALMAHEAVNGVARLAALRGAAAEGWAPDR